MSFRQTISLIALFSLACAYFLLWFLWLHEVPLHDAARIVLASWSEIMTIVFLHLFIGVALVDVRERAYRIWLRSRQWRERRDNG